MLIIMRPSRFDHTFPSMQTVSEGLLRVTWVATSDRCSSISAQSVLSIANYGNNVFKDFFFGYFVLRIMIRKALQ